MTLTKKEIIQRLQQLDGQQFEHFIADLWEMRGWDTSVTSESNDEGIDVIAQRQVPFPEKELIQAKRYRMGNRVTGPELQQYGSLHQQDQEADKVLVITTSEFTDSALSLADRLKVKPINCRDLATIILNEEATDLVKSYSKAVDGDFQLPNRESSSDQSSEQRNPTRPLTIREDGEELTVEIAGMERVTISSRGGGLLSGASKQFEGLLLAFHLYNRTNNDLIIEEFNEFKLWDESGTSYSAANLGKGHFGDWSTHGGRGYVDDGWIYAGDSKKYAVGFSIPKSARPSKITLERYGIGIELDHDDRNSVEDLPKDLRKEI